MNRDQIEGNWKQLKGKAQQQWGKLTDDDLDRIAGKQEELEGRIQERYGKTREAAKREVDAWLQGHCRPAERRTRSGASVQARRFGPAIVAGGDRRPQHGLVL